MVFKHEKLNEKDGYIAAPMYVGVVCTEGNDCVLVDSGSDKDSAKRILRTLNEEGLHITKIFDTHFHADHTGGGNYFQAQTGCNVYSPEIDSHFTETPLLEPTCLYGGYPFKELHHKFLMAQPSICEKLSSENASEFSEIIDLRGHSPRMVGFRTYNNTVYLADAVSAREILEKYKITYLWNVAESLETLERIKTLDADIFIPAHVPPTHTEELHELAQYNIKVIHEVAEKIIEYLKAPMIFEDLLQLLFSNYDMAMNLRQYVLVGSSVKSYLAWLKDTDKLTYDFTDNKMYWMVK